MFWNQLPNLKYKPKPRLIQNENHAEAFSRHFDTQIFNYGRQVLVNLVGMLGFETNQLIFFVKLLLREMKRFPDERYIKRAHEN